MLAFVSCILNSLVLILPVRDGDIPYSLSHLLQIMLISTMVSLFMHPEACLLFVSFLTKVTYVLCVSVNNAVHTL